MLLLLTEVQVPPDSSCSIIFLSSSFLMRSWEILLLRFFHLARSWFLQHVEKKKIHMHSEEKANRWSKQSRGWNRDTYVLPVVFLFLHLVVLIVHQFMAHLTVGLQDSLLLRTHVNHAHTPAERHRIQTVNSCAVVLWISYPWFYNICMRVKIWKESIMIVKWRFTANKNDIMNGLYFKSCTHDPRIESKQSGIQKSPFSNR